MFVGRENELKFLNNCYGSDNAEFVVLYGRRRVGKTETLKEFCKDKPHVFYSCREYTSEKQLSAFSDTLLSWKPEIKVYTDSFADWDKAFSFIGEMGGEEKRSSSLMNFPICAKAIQAFRLFCRLYGIQCLKIKI